MAEEWITEFQRYGGTAADRAALSTASLRAGAYFFEYDTQIEYIWLGGDWRTR